MTTDGRYELERFLHSILVENYSYRLARFPRYPLDVRIQKSFDALVPEEAAKSFGHIRLFSMQQPVIAFDYRNPAAESTHGLR